MSRGEEARPTSSCERRLFTRGGREQVVDEEARALANEAYDRTVALLTERKELVKVLAEIWGDLGRCERDEHTS